MKYNTAECISRHKSTSGKGKELPLRLTTYFSLIFAVLVIVVIGSATLLIGQRINDDFKSEIGAGLASTAYQIADKQDYYMYSRYNEILVLSKLSSLRLQSNLQETEIVLDELVKNIPSFAWIGVVDIMGVVVAATGGNLAGVNIAERPVYKEGMKGPFVGDVHEAVLLNDLLNKGNEEPLKFVDISMPLYDDNGNQTGVLASHLSSKWSVELRDSVLEGLKGSTYDEIEVFIVSRMDNTVLSGPDAWTGQQLVLEGMEERAENNEWAIVKWPDGHQYLTGYSKSGGHLNYPGLGWKIIVRQPESVAFLPVSSLMNHMINITFLLIFIFVILAPLLSKQVAKPISRISEAANRLRFGEQVAIPYTKGIKELQILSSSLRALIAELTKTETELERMEDVARRDKLTGLLNRGGLDTVLHKAMRRTEVWGGELAFFYMDLDGFKGVNDTYGHGAGDMLLQIVAERLRDIARNDDYLFRIGGDEFLIVLTVAGDDAVHEAEEVAFSILRAMRKPFQLDGSIVTISCSLGGAMWPAVSPNPEELMKAADQALYESKDKGKNQLTLYESPVE
jgi:diguanylate cyclase (GGDEF)-like protein